jgi:peptidoglycan/LPS O-acetylase OafA/YrhL
MPQKSDLSGQTNITGSRLPSLTGLRFIAALMVFAFHSILYGGLFSSPGTTQTLGSVVSGGGWTGVSFFFVLSGFVLTWSVRSADTVGKFYRRRLFKIFPNHIVTLSIAFLLLIWVTGAVASGKWWINFFLIQAWFPDLSVLYAGNQVSWSLSCELLFYLSFPLLYFGIKRIRPERLWAWAGVVVVAIFLVPTLANIIPPAQALSGPAIMPVTDLNLWEQWFVTAFPPVRMLEFIFGIVLARIVITGRTVPLSLGGAVAFAIAAYAVTPLFPGPYRVAALMVVPLGLVIAAGAKTDARNEGGWLSSRFMVWLGDVSFAFYMVHWLVIDYGHRLLGQTTSWNTVVGLLVWTGLLVAAVGIAALLYSGVERPVMRKFSSSKRRLAAVPAAAVSTGSPGGDRLAS